MIVNTMEGEPRSSPDAAEDRAYTDLRSGPQWRGSREAPRKLPGRRNGGGAAKLPGPGPVRSLQTEAAAMEGEPRSSLR